MRTKRRAMTPRWSYEELNACMLDHQIQQRKRSDAASAMIEGFSTGTLVHGNEQRQGIILTWVAILLAVNFNRFFSKALSKIE